MFGKIGKILKIVEGLGKDVTDVKALISAVLAMLADVKAVLAEVKGITSSTPAVAGSVVVAAPPAGHVLVAIPAEHVAALPDALANIVAGVDPMKGVKLP
jgi:hypothetical protein